MREDVKQAIECWASRPTWFSVHPSDTRQLKQAVSNLKKLTPRPTEGELRAAIYQRVQDLPAMPGTPNDIEHATENFAAKIIKRI